MNVPITKKAKESHSNKLPVMQEVTIDAGGKKQTITKNLDKAKFGSCGCKH
jgi:hypothetical protein